MYRFRFGIGYLVGPIHIGLSLEAKWSKIQGWQTPRRIKMIVKIIFP